MFKETKLVKEIKIWCGKNDILCFHLHVGKLHLFDDTWFTHDLPEGWPDLILFDNKGKTYFCETKIHPRKPTSEQLETIELLKKKGFKAFVAYSLEEFINEFQN